MRYLLRKRLFLCKMEGLSPFGIVPIDVGVLETLFASYKHPQKKITNLEQKGKLIRLKKELYVVSQDVSKQFLSVYRKP